MQEIERLLDLIDAGAVSVNLVQPQILMSLGRREIDHTYKNGEVVNRCVRKFGQLGLTHWFTEHTEAEYMRSRYRALGLMRAAFDFGVRYTNNPVWYIITNTARSGEELKHSVAYTFALRTALTSPSINFRKITIELSVIPFPAVVTTRVFWVDMIEMMAVIDPAAAFGRPPATPLQTSESNCVVEPAYEYVVRTQFHQHSNNSGDIKRLFAFLQLQIMFPLSSTHLLLHLLPLLSVEIDGSLFGTLHLDIIGDIDTHVDVVLFAMSRFLYQSRDLAMGIERFQTIYPMIYLFNPSVYERASVYLANIARWMGIPETILLETHNLPHTAYLNLRQGLAEMRSAILPVYQRYLGRYLPQPEVRRMIEEISAIPLMSIAAERRDAVIRNLRIVWLDRG